MAQMSQTAWNDLCAAAARTLAQRGETTLDGYKIVQEAYADADAIWPGADECVDIFAVRDRLDAFGFTVVVLCEDPANLSEPPKSVDTARLLLAGGRGRKAICIQICDENSPYHKAWLEKRNEHIGGTVETFRGQLDKIIERKQLAATEKQRMLGKIRNAATK